MKQTLTYNYNKRQSRIITPVKVSYGNKSFVVNALWDTGATYSCITNIDNNTKFTFEITNLTEM